MADIVNLHEYLYSKTFKEQAISFFQRIQFSYQSYRENDGAVFILKPQSYLIVFVKYVHKNTYTELPTLEESLYDKKSSPRHSKGEWVVERVFEMQEKYGKELFYMLENNKSNPYSYLKNIFRR